MLWFLILLFLAISLKLRILILTMYCIKIVIHCVLNKKVLCVS